MLNALRLGYTICLLAAGLVGITTGCADKGSKTVPIRVFPSECNVYPLPANTLRSMLFAIQNTSEIPMTVRSISGAERYECSFDRDIRAHGVGYLTLRLIMPKEADFVDRLSVVCQLGEQTIGRPIVIRRSRSGQGESRAVTPAVIEVGRVTPGTVVDVKTTIGNDGSTPLVLSAPKFSCVCTKGKTIPPAVVDPGQTAEYEFTVSVPNKEGSVDFRGPSFLTNDPKHQVLSINMHAIGGYDYLSSPTLVNFRSLQPGVTQEISLVLRHSHGDDVQIDDILTSDTPSVKSVSRQRLQDGSYLFRLALSVPLDKSFVQTAAMFSDRTGKLLCFVPIVGQVQLSLQAIPDAISFSGVPASSIEAGTAFRDIAVISGDGKPLEFVSAVSPLDGLTVVEGQPTQPDSGRHTGTSIRLRTALTKVPESGSSSGSLLLTLMHGGRATELAIPVVIQVDSRR